MTDTTITVTPAEATGDPASVPDPKPTETPTEPDKGFPDATPLAEMTVEQREAYWKHQARKHEQRANQRGDYDELRQKATEYDAWKQQQMSEHEKAVEAARQEGRKAALDEANKGAVTAILRANLTARGKSSDEADEILAALSPNAFVGEDGPDTDKVAAFVNRIAGPIAQHHPDLGQGNRGSGPKSEDDINYEKLFGPQG